MLLPMQHLRLAPLSRQPLLYPSSAPAQQQQQQQGL
jgi:hypothetical protein